MRRNVLFSSLLLLQKLITNCHKVPYSLYQKDYRTMNAKPIWGCKFIEYKPWSKQAQPNQNPNTELNILLQYNFTFPFSGNFSNDGYILLQYIPHNNADKFTSPFAWNIYFLFWTPSYYLFSACKKDIFCLSQTILKLIPFMLSSWPFLVPENNLCYLIYGHNHFATIIFYSYKISFEQ